MGFNRRRGSVRRVLLSVRLGEKDEFPIFGRRLLWIARDVTEHRQAEADRTNLLLQLRSAQEDERKRLSRDLHDHLGQTATALVLGIQAVRAAGPLPPAALAALDRLQRLAAELGQQVHEIALRLRPTVLDDVGLEAALSRTRWRLVGTNGSAGQLPGRHGPRAIPTGGGNGPLSSGPGGAYERGETRPGQTRRRGRDVPRWICQPFRGG